MLAVVLYRIQSEEGRQAAWTTLTQARWPLVLLAGLLSTAHLCAKGLRWRAILLARGIPARAGHTVPGYFSGCLIGAFTPGRVGEFAKAVLLHRWYPQIHAGTSLGSVVLDRLFDVILLLLVGGYGGLALYRPEWLWPAALAGGLGLIVGIWWLQSGHLTPDRLGAYCERWLRRLPGRAGDSAAEFTRTLMLSLQRPALLIALWTLAAYALFFAHFIMLARATGTDLPVHVLVPAIALACLGAILPISISGIGVRDYILVSVFTRYGGAAHAAVIVSLIYLLLFNLVVAAVGYWPLAAARVGARAPGKG